MRTVEERFWDKVAIAGPEDCWPWTASLKSSGYGQFKVRADRPPQSASRVAWMLFYGEAGLFHVLHHCDNPPCCNPRHLFLGTAADNADDMVSKGRQITPDRPSIKAIREAQRRLSDADIEEARRSVRQGESRRSVARRLGVHPTTIIRLINEKHWVNYLV